MPCQRGSVAHDLSSCFSSRFCTPCLLIFRRTGFYLLEALDARLCIGASRLVRIGRVGQSGRIACTQSGNSMSAQTALLMAAKHSKRRLTGFQLLRQFWRLGTGLEQEFQGNGVVSLVSLPAILGAMQGPA